MNIFKKIFKKTFKTKSKETEPTEKPNECWYNNVHDAERGSGVPIDGAGSPNSFECGVTKSNAMH